VTHPIWRIVRRIGASCSWIDEFAEAAGLNAMEKGQRERTKWKRSG